MTARACKGCGAHLRAANLDIYCAPCQAAEERRLATLQPGEPGSRRDRHETVVAYPTGREASSSMIGAALRISYADVRRLIQELQAEGVVRRLERDGPGGVARYTAVSDEPEEAA